MQGECREDGALNCQVSAVSTSKKDDFMRFSGIQKVDKLAYKEMCGVI